MIYPIWYVLMFSLSGSQKIIINNYYLLPNELSFETYKYIFRDPGIFLGFKNSTIVTIGGVAISLLMTAIAAYPLALAKNLPGRKIFLNIILFIMIFNGGIIPTYLIIQKLNMRNTLWSLMVPFCINVFYWLVMMKFFKGIPESLIESAKMDGYNDIAILMKIILPLSTAVLAALGLFCAVSYWNIYFSGILYITDPKKRVLQVILMKLTVESEGLGNSTGMAREKVSSPQNLKMTAIIVTAAPIIVIYPFLQKYFAKGIMLGSVKG